MRRLSSGIEITLVIISTLMSCRDNNINNRLKIPSAQIKLLNDGQVINTMHINKQKPIVFMLYSPDCEDCQEETQLIINNIDSLKDIEFYFITSDSANKASTFRDYFKLSRFKNITMALDYQYAFYNYFKPIGTPYTILYNQNKSLNRIIIGKTSLTSLYNLINNN